MTENPGYLLLNETKSIEAGTHLGCNHVVDCIHQQMQRMGFELIGVANEVAECEWLSKTPEISRVNLIVLNGEGSCHHDPARILELMEFCRSMKSRGCASVLINTVWQDNTDMLGKYLPVFDLVCVRETRSKLSMSAWRQDVRVVPDLAFVGFSQQLVERPMGPSEETPFKAAVIDNVLADRTDQLYQYASRHRFPFYLMGTLHVERMLGDTAHAYSDGRQDYPRRLDDLQQLAAADAVITGRFHALVAAMCLQKPVLAIPSNTHKIEGTLEDAGILRESLLDLSWLASEPRQREELVESKLQLWDRHVYRRMETYVARAITSIREMFVEIGDLGKRSRVPVRSSIVSQATSRFKTRIRKLKDKLTASYGRVS